MAAPESTSVCVAWVHSTEVAYSFFASMLNLQGQFVTGVRRGRWLAMRYGSGGIVEARNRAVTEFLDGDDDWLFWIDTDMGFAPDSIDRLLAQADPTERPVVGGLCFANREVSSDGFGGFATFPIPTVYMWGRNPDGTTGFVSWHDYPADELFRCDGTGSAFILIHRSVFERMQHTRHRDNWYGLIADPQGGAFSEDLSFCVRLNELEIPLHVDTSVHTSHLKPVWLSETHYHMHREMAAKAGVTSQQASVKTAPNRAERRRQSRADA